MTFKCLERVLTEGDTNTAVGARPLFLCLSRLMKQSALQRNRSSGLPVLSLKIPSVVRWEMSGRKESFQGLVLRVECSVFPQRCFTGGSGLRSQLPIISEKGLFQDEERGGYLARSGQALTQAVTAPVQILRNNLCLDFLSPHLFTREANLTVKHQKKTMEGARPETLF